MNLTIPQENQRQLSIGEEIEKSNYLQEFDDDFTIFIHINIDHCFGYFMFIQVIYHFLFTFYPERIEM